MKSHSKRLLALVLALCLTLTAAPAALAAESFSDVGTDHWAYDDIMACAEQEIVTGFEDGRFCPEDPVTSVQLIVMLTRTFYGDQVEEAKKTETSSWYAPYVKVAEDIRMSNGLTIEDNPINRYDMALALYNVILNQGKKSSATQTQLTNAQNSIKEWDQIQGTRYTNPVKYNYALGIITGMGDGGFHGEETMTRAQACTVMQRMIALISGDAPEKPEAGSGKLANGEDITVENVLAILEEIKSEYPDETIWGEKGTAGNHYYADGGTAGSDMVELNKKFVTYTGYRADLAYGCGGWACMLTERIFGKTGYPFREVTDLMNVRPGDVIIQFNSDGKITHYSVVTSTAYSYKSAIDGSTKWKFNICDGNVISHGIGRVGWDNSGTPNDTTIKVYTRYPE